ncbi:MAG: riboflavin biosynthesis protein RibF, partial [Pseudomonadota bacterium]
HPREYFSPHAPAFRLMNAVAKANRLQKIGVQKLYQLNFNAALSGLSAEEFAQKVLADGLGLRHVLVGEDFCFGKGRSGTASDLRAFGNDMGFGVTITHLVGEDNQVYSSTAIRNALSAGYPKEAAKMLGHYHRIEGEVLHGDARGRDLGYPTANMSLEGLHKPKFGIYAVLVDVLTGAHQGQYHGVASLGERPTFGVNIPNLETFIFDFTGDLYGAELSVALVDFQRPELKFESLEALIKQMDADSMQARQILTTL